jgi:hypothetical protein
LPAQSSSTSVAVQSGKHGIIGLAIHLAGFVLGFIGIGLVLGGVIDIESGISVIVPFADLLYGLGLVIVVAVAARAGLPMKYLLIAAHEIHIASGIGFGLVHPAHTMLGMILIALSLAALAVLTIRYNNKSLVIMGRG